MPKVQPRIEYLDGLLRELRDGKLRIPGFQRPFEWSNTQMERLLESVQKQFPIGSLLIWETSAPVRSLDGVGPHSVPSSAGAPNGPVRYLLDGHQRMSALAGTLLPLPTDIEEPKARRWRIFLDLRDPEAPQVRRLTQEDSERGDVHGERDPLLVPVSILLDAVAVHVQVTEILNLGATEENKKRVARLREVSSVFQRYAIPVNIITEASLKEAVEIFSLINTQGRRVSPDRVFTALSMDSDRSGGDLTQAFDALQAEGGVLRRHGFGDLPRMVLYRATLAALGEDIYKSPWEVFQQQQPRLKDMGETLDSSLALALGFLTSQMGIRSVAVLPYSVQLIGLSEFFRLCPSPTEAQVQALVRALWRASLTGAYGAGGSLKLGQAIEEFRGLARGQRMALSEDGNVASPLPRRFNPRSARVRALFLFLATRAVDLDTGEPLSQPLQAGFQGSAPIWSRTARNEYEELENRVLCRKEHRRVVRKKLTELMLSPDSERRQRILDGLVIPPDALHLLDRPEDRPAFNRQRRAWLIEQEAAFYAQWGIEPAPPGEVDDGDDVESDTEPEVVEQID